MKISAKILGGYIFLMLIFLILAFSINFFTKSIRPTINQLDVGIKDVSMSTTISDSINEIKLLRLGLGQLITNHFINKDDINIKKYDVLSEKLDTTINKTREKMDNAIDKRIFEDLLKNNKILEQSEREILQRIEENKMEEAKILLTQKEYSNLNVEFMDFIEKYASRNRKESGDIFSQLISTSVVIRSSLEKLHFLEQMVFGFLIMTLVLSLFYILFIHHFFSLPIKKLTKTISDISAGNLNSKMDNKIIQSKDEIGELARDFDTMTAKLKKSREIIEKHSNELERKVKDRTKELELKEVELIEINKNLEDANQKLSDLDKQKDEFISVAAHELKTPLTSIKGFAQLMRDQKVMKDREKRDHYLELINQDTERLYDLILDIVDSSRLSLGKLDLSIEETEVMPIFNEIKEHMNIIIQGKGLRPNFSIEKNLPKINADSTRLLQVLKNLLINAVHFTEKGTVSLRIYKKGKCVQFEVNDTGEGIPKDAQPHIFSKFYQADASLTRKVKGSGLGLSLSKGLVETMGGKIWFESGEGKGTTFYFTIPITKGGKKDEK